MTERSLNRSISFIYLTIGLIPVVWMILVLTNYLLTAHELGQLPKCGVNFGQERFPLPYSGTLNMILMMTTFWGLVVIPFVIVAHFLLGLFLKPIPKLTLKQGLTSYLGYGLYLLLCSFDPFMDMMTWYID